MGRLSELTEVVNEITSSPSLSAEACGQLLVNAVSELRAHGHGEASIELAQRTIDYGKEHDCTDQRVLVPALELAGRCDEALALQQALVAEVGTPANHVFRSALQGQLGVLAARCGEREQAVAASDELEHLVSELDETEQHVWGLRYIYQRARIAAQLGMRDEAMELMREAQTQGLGFTIRLHRDHAFEPLRDYPPFQELTRPKG
jgi:hypothetical protein